MAEIGQHLWRPSNPSLLLKCGQVQQVAQDRVWLGFVRLVFFVWLVLGLVLLFLFFLKQVSFCLFTS